MAIQHNDNVSVHYTGTFEDGETFDSSRERGPLSFEVGAGQMIKGFDEAVVGMEVGEAKQITLPPEDAYGLRNEEMVVDLPRTSFPGDMELEMGLQLQLTNKDGQPIPATVVNIGDENITMDVNHPMAGKTLVFDIEIVEVN
ncbi:MAG: peptidylprolyl isomerase [Desulfobulbaceae bacterium]|jgi:peptidylprolyl isomerase|nr:peptidylprolyl isomerase [Desulfobulbaceae bacterium]